MKKALGYIGFLFVVLCLAQVSVYAQDGPSNEHPLPDEKMDHSLPVSDMDTEGEGRTLAPVTKSVGKDSSAAKLPAQRSAKSNQESSKEVKPQQPAPPSGAGDDSILSFNFIYYIIQKFKLQDIIE